MRRFRPLMALLLAALWLPVTQHCDLEAAGVFAAHCASEADTTGCGGGEHCTTDDCGTLESGDYRHNDDALKLSPRLTACLCLVGHQATSTLLSAGVERVPAEEWERPTDWLPSWSFARRAAALAHAPDLLIA